MIAMAATKPTMAGVFVALCDAAPDNSARIEMQNWSDLRTQIKLTSANISNNQFKRIVDDLRRAKLLVYCTPNQRRKLERESTLTARGAQYEKPLPEVKLFAPAKRIVAMLGDLPDGHTIVGNGMEVEQLDGRFGIGSYEAIVRLVRVGVVERSVKSDRTTYITYNLVY